MYPVRDPRTSTATMLAARVVAERPGALEVGEAPLPVAGPTELVVRVRSVGLNQVDLNVMDGVGPGAAAALPRTIGIDPSGEVVAQGDEVRGDRIGTRVVVKPNIACGACRYCGLGEEADCTDQKIVGVHRDGGAAQYVAVPAANAFDIGDLEYVVATAAVHSAPIALHAIDAAGGTGPGERVLVTGASGSVGTAAAAIARHLGADVVTASRSATGPDAIRYADAAGLADVLRERADDGFDLVVDASGHAAVAAAAVGALRWRGRAVLCSASVSSGLALDARRLYLRRLTVRGVASADYDQVRRGLELVRSGVVRPAIAARFPLADIDKAVAQLQDRHVSGKVVIDVE